MREATKSDLPWGAIAQCPVCWRMFGGDSTCEKHKQYTAGPTICRDPAQLGFQAIERRGLVVWSRKGPRSL